MSEIPVTYTGDASSLQSASQQASDAVSSATGDINSSVGASTSAMAGMGGGAMRMGVTGMAAFMMIDAASERLQSTQMQQTMAQERLTEAVQKYGAGSVQAVLAQQQLQVATDNVGRATDQYYMRLAMAAATTIPQVLSMMTKLGTTTEAASVQYLNLGADTQALTAAQVQESASMDGVILSDEEATAVSAELSASYVTQTATTNALTSSRLALMAASGIGLIAALGIAAAISSGALNPSGGASTGTNINVYGDVNVPGAASPAAFASSLGSYRG